MKKSKILSIILVLCALWMVTCITKAQWQLTFDNKYFSSPNWNPIYSDNISDIYFTYQWNDWYWLFLLWTWTTTNTKLTINGNEITCNKQINWYLTTNFTNFWMFPLDEITQDKIQDNGINYITWWLYYECTWYNGTKTGIYWYIKWTYWENWENTQEIRAWLTSDNNNRASTSPMELVYSTNFRNDNRSISGQFLSSLTQQSNVIPRFTRDVWIENNTAIGTNENTYYIIDATQYSNAWITIYAKTEKPWYQIQYMLTWFDTNWRNIYVTWTDYLGVNAENTLYGFHWYSTRHIPYVTEIKSWYVTAIFEDNTSKSFWFIISWGATNFALEINCYEVGDHCECTWWTNTAIITPTENANTYQYNRTWSFITWQYQYIFTTHSTWGIVKIKSSDWDIVANLEYEEILIDTTPPSLAGELIGRDTDQINTNSNDVDIPQCTTNLWKVKIIATDEGCWNEKIELNCTKNGNECENPDGEPKWRGPGNSHTEEKEYSIELNTTKTGLNTYMFTAKDTVWNSNNITYTFNIIDTPITWQNFKRSLKIIDNNWYKYISTWNWKKLSKAHAWECEENDIEATEWVCNNGWIIIINGYNFTYTWNADYDECNITIKDSDGSTTIVWTFYDCSHHVEECKPRIKPEIIAWEAYVDYEDLWFQNSTLKYTSWVQVTVKLNAEWISEIVGYKASCIRQQEYCTKLIEWEPKCDWDAFCNNLYTFIEDWKLLWNEVKICDNSKKGWPNNRIDYPNTDEFLRNLQTSSGCEYVEDVPYWSRDQGQRKIWVEVIDEDGNKSNVTETSIPVNYTTESPTLKWTYEKNYEEITYYWMFQTVEKKNTIQYANQASFTTTVKANWATLNNWEVWLNYEHENEISSYWILRRPWNLMQKLLYFDDLNEWIISVFGDE